MLLNQSLVMLCIFYNIYVTLKVNDGDAFIKESNRLSYRFILFNIWDKINDPLRKFVYIPNMFVINRNSSCLNFG